MLCFACAENQLFGSNFDQQWMKTSYGSHMDGGGYICLNFNDITPDYKVKKRALVSRPPQ